MTEAQYYVEQHTTIMEAALTLESIDEAFKIKDIPELHDRLIAAEAKKLDIPILTNDPDMHQSNYVEAIWG